MIGCEVRFIYLCTEDKRWGWAVWGLAEIGDVGIMVNIVFFCYDIVIYNAVLPMYLTYQS